MADQQQPTHAQLLSQAVEREVRTVMGDLQMQVIVLRQMLELAQQGHQVPMQAAQPQPTPLRPVPTPEGESSLHRRPNGGGV